MKSKERKDAIAAYVLDHGDARIDDLVTEFAVSRMTILRHLDDLAGQGVLRKLHGSVTAQPSSVYESLFAFRQSQCTQEKATLAASALGEIELGQVVLIDDSTTATALGPILPQKAPLTIVTNSLGLINEIAIADGLTLLSLGGDYHPTYNAFIGHLCESAIAALQVNVFVCSASAVMNGCAYVQDPQVTRVKQAMFKAAQRRILLVDASKFEKSALHLFAPLSDFDIVITEASLLPTQVEKLTAMGVTLKLVTKE